MNEFQELDILLFKGTDCISKLIEFGTKSPYSHVAIVVNPKENLGIESQAGRQSGVRAFALNNITVPIDIYRLKTQNYDKNYVISFLVSHLEARYDYLGVIRLGLLKLLNILTFNLTKVLSDNFQRNKDYFCSELCYSAFMAGGIDIVPQIASAAITAPADIARSPLIEKVN